MRGSQLRSARLDHYLELLKDKPGALEHSLALRQEREQGRWPECFDELWTLLRERVGASEAARQIVDVLMLCRDHDPEIVELAVRGALAAGAIDGRAVALLLDRKTRPPAERDRAARPARPARAARPEPGRVRPAARHRGGGTVSGFWEIEAAVSPGREILVDG